MDEEIKIYQEASFATLKKLRDMLVNFPDIPSALYFIDCTLTGMKKITTRDIEKDSQRWM